MIPKRHISLILFSESKKSTITFPMEVSKLVLWDPHIREMTEIEVHKGQVLLKECWCLIEMIQEVWDKSHSFRK